jgi:5'-nucleotidase
MPISAIAALAALALADPARCVTVVGTNDLHGHIAEIGAIAGASKNAGAGLAWLAGYLRVLRRMEGPILLVDGGDLFQGTLESNLNHGRAVIAAYNAMGYDASVLGNHEFDYGPDTSGEDVLSSIRHRVGEASFPFLSVNVRDRATGKAPGWKNLVASKVFELDGLRVGVLGVANPDTPNLTQRRYVEGLDFLEATEPVESEAARLRSQGAKLVVLVAHEGSACDVEVADEAAACPHGGQLVSLLHALKPGTVDVAVGGHTHQFIAHWIAGVPTIESGAEGRYFGRIRACAKPGAQGGIDRATTQIFAPVRFTAQGEFLGQRVARDETVARLIQPYVDAVREMSERPLGPVLKAPLRRDNRGPSDLGRLVADALRDASGTRLALMNAGGLRSDLAAGPLTYGALYQTLPFDNHAVVVKLTGAQLLQLVSAIGKAGHGYPQVAGMTLVGKAGDFTGATLEDGSSLDPKASYALATVDFLATGGDGTGALMQQIGPDNVHPAAGDPLLREAVLAYLKKHADTPLR